MEITKMQTKAFWKSEVGISGQVRDGEKLYDVKLEVKGSYVNSCSCSCTRGISYKEMCPHEKALLRHYQDQASRQTAPPVSTSSQVRTMIREYTNMEVAGILGEEGEQSVRFVPHILFGRQGIRAEFCLVSGRKYVIKDLTAFARTVEQGAYGEYGKHLAFHHTMAAFSPECRKLLGLVLEMVGTYEEHYEQFRKSVYASVSSLRELDISRSSRDRFFALLAGQTIEGEDPHGTRQQIRVVSQNPEKAVTVRSTGRNGVRLTVDREIFTFSGEKNLYVLRGSCLYICDEKLSRDGDVFFRHMTQGYGAPYEATVSEKDMPLFYERILRKLEACALLDTGDLDLEKYRPLELKARFELENPAPGQVILHPTLSYGDYSFHPVDDGNVPGSICRDVPREFYISQILTRYFKYKDPGTDDLMIRDDEEALFLFLSQGIDKLKEVGDVCLPEGENALRILPPPRVSVGVQVTDQWLDLTVDAGEMSSREMTGILEAYRRKKPYYRLKSGEVLRLEDSGLLAVARMVDGLSLSKKEQTLKSIRVPRYRALYLDALCRGRPDILFTRDHTYRAIIRGMKLAGDSDYAVPKEMSDVLRDYQKNGFGWLKTLDAWGFGGLLADDMGLGKTIQIISLLLDASGEKEEKSLSLVVCPASLIYNWESEIETFAPSLRVLTVTGTSQERELLLKNAADFDVVVTSYDLLRRDLPRYEEYRFRFQIIDEAQYIKNPGTQNARAVKAVRSVTRYALTGTPVENRLSELWSIFDYLMPGFLYTYQKFRREFEGPIVKEKDERALERLRQMTSPFILRRLKKDVLKELPGKMESVVYSRMEGEQKKLYRATAWQLRKQLAGQNRIQILAGLTRARQVCCDPRLIYDDYGGGCAKLETCMELVLSGIGAGHKILVFSQFASMLRLIGKRMAGEGIAFHMLTGETSKEERISMVNAFHQDDVPVFLISLKAGGTGLNLTRADMVIHYDPWWNVAAQNQATDRAHRIGQDKQVMVFKLITRDTIEENILKLQKAKENLAGQVVTEGMVSLGELTPKELMGLLG